MTFLLGVQTATKFEAFLRDFQRKNPSRTVKIACVSALEYDFRKLQYTPSIGRVLLFPVPMLFLCGFSRFLLSCGGFLLFFLFLYDFLLFFRCFVWFSAVFAVPVWFPAVFSAFFCFQLSAKAVIPPGRPFGQKRFSWL